MISNTVNQTALLIYAPRVNPGFVTTAVTYPEIP